MRDGYRSDGGYLSAKECLEVLLARPLKTAEHIEKLREMGVPKCKMNYNMLLMSTLLDKAVNNGDVTAIKEIRSIVFENKENGNGAIEQLILGMKDD